MAAAESSDLMYRLLVQGVKDYAIYLLDADGNVMNWNGGAERAKGYRAEEIVGRNFELFYTDEDRRAGLPRHNLRVARREGHLTTEGWRKRKDGSVFWASVVIDPVYDDAGAFLGFAKITRDRTEQREAERRLFHLANHDSLTGLPNRTAFAAALAETLDARNQGASFAVHYLDLDRFKPVNDSFGHDAGDALLQEVGSRLLNVTGARDVVARLGGDEFAILQVALDGPQAASRLADRVIASLSQPFLLGAAKAVIGASVGIACAPADGSSAAILLRNADLALYEAKQRGRGRHCFYDETLNERAAKRRILETKLRHAVSHHAFELHYQPIVSGRTGETVAYEALLRWTDAEGETIGPAEFIPLAENLGLMKSLGGWVLREACSQAATWANEAVVAVNVSVVQLRDPAFFESVEGVLAETGLPPHRLELEITETAVMENVEAAAALLKRLRALGVAIALDDFGTGFSSLSLVQTLPLTRIKIDKSFVQAVDDTARSAAMIQALVSLCRGLGLATTAEGIETDEQKRALTLQGCQDLQGYLLGRPRSMARSDGARQVPSRVSGEMA